VGGSGEGGRGSVEGVAMGWDGVLTGAGAPTGGKKKRSIAPVQGATARILESNCYRGKKKNNHTPRLEPSRVTKKGEKGVEVKKKKRHRPPYCTTHRGRKSIFEIHGGVQCLRYGRRLSRLKEKRTPTPNVTKSARTGKGRERPLTNGGGREYMRGKTKTKKR